MATSMNESKDEKMKRVNNLRWGVHDLLVDQDKIMIFTLTIILFLFFLFINEQSEVAGPKADYPLLYYIAVFSEFVLGLIIINWLHKKTLGNRKTRFKEKLVEALDEDDEIDANDPEYNEILAGL